jgi:hypothetical protein
VKLLFGFYNTEQEEPTIEFYVGLDHVYAHENALTDFFYWSYWSLGIIKPHDPDTYTRDIALINVDHFAKILDAAGKFPLSIE